MTLSRRCSPLRALLLSRSAPPKSLVGSPPHLSPIAFSTSCLLTIIPFPILALDRPILLSPPFKAVRRLSKHDPPQRCQGFPHPWSPAATSHPSASAPTEASPSWSQPLDFTKGVSFVQIPLWQHLASSLSVLFAVPRAHSLIAKTVPQNVLRKLKCTYFYRHSPSLVWLSISSSTCISGA